MRIGVAVDSSCDLPAEFIRAHQIKILPNAILLGTDVYIDERDPAATLAFYESQVGDKSHDAETVPFSVEQIQKVFLDRLVLDFDFVLCIPAWKARSQVYENCVKASLGILSHYHKHRRAAGLTDLFAMRVLDAKTISTGTAVLAAEAVRLAGAGKHAKEVRVELEQMMPDVVSYFVPAHLAYVRKRAAKRGEKSIGLAAYLIGSALDIKPVILIHREESRAVSKARGLTPAIEKALKHVAGMVRGGRVRSHFVCISYGGDPSAVRGLSSYADLEDACRERGVQLLVSIMSAVAAVNTGPDGFAVAYVGDYQAMN